MDEEYVGSARLQPGAARIQSMPGSEGGLYLGGVPPGGDFYGTAASLVPLRGCLRDLVINGQ